VPAILDYYTSIPTVGTGRTVEIEGQEKPYELKVVYDELVVY